jgi:hypothetical protein
VECQERPSEVKDKLEHFNLLHEEGSLMPVRLIWVLEAMYLTPELAVSTHILGATQTSRFEWGLQQKESLWPSFM